MSKPLACLRGRLTARERTVGCLHGYYKPLVVQLRGGQLRVEDPGFESWTGKVNKTLQVEKDIARQKTSLAFKHLDSGGSEKDIAYSYVLIEYLLRSVNYQSFVYNHKHNYKIIPASYLNRALKRHSMSA